MRGVTFVFPGASTGLCKLSQSANELGSPRLSRNVHRQDFISKECMGSTQSEIAPTGVNGRNLSLGKNIEKHCRKKLMKTDSMKNILPFK